MTEHTEIRAEILVEILEAALGAVEEGIAVLDSESRVLLWNPAAAAITGYHSSDLLYRSLPENLYKIDEHHTGSPERPISVLLRHAQGHVLPAMLRRTQLRDALGKRFGMLVRFHPVEEVDSMPHGEMDDDGNLQKHVESSQADMQDRLDQAWQDWTLNRIPFGLLWITVDQAATLRRTHGHDGSEAMLGIVERTLLHALRPTEMLGRWGTHEFLVLSHERTREMLDAHARHVCELARTADFRWWGDRVSLSVSVGGAQAAEDTSWDCKLSGLLKRAQTAMQAAVYAGGNTVVVPEAKMTASLEVGRDIPGDTPDNRPESREQECSQS